MPWRCAVRRLSSAASVLLGHVSAVHPSDLAGMVPSGTEAGMAAEFARQHGLAMRPFQDAQQNQLDAMRKMMGFR